MNKTKQAIKIGGIGFTSLTIFYMTYSNIKPNLIHLYYLLTLVLQVSLTWELFLLFLKKLDKNSTRFTSLKKRLFYQLTGGTVVVLFAFTSIQLLIYPIDKLILHRHRLHGYWDYDIFICFLLALIIQLVYIIYYLFVHWQNVSKPNHTNNVEQDFILRLGNRQIVLPAKNIRCFFTENKAVYALTEDGNKYILDLSLEKITEMVSKTEFYRVNRQFIIRKTSIQQVKSLPNNRLSVETDFYNEIPLPIIISRNNTPQFRKWFNR